MNAIRDALGRVERGTPVSVDRLTMTPLLSMTAGEPGYLTLQEAVEGKTVKVREVSDAGRVPELLVINNGEKPGLILDGEELVGAKQNRTVNLSIMIPPFSKTTIPVTCVEQNRWVHESDEFVPSPNLHFSSARAAKMQDVTLSMAASGARSSDQIGAWQEIAEAAGRLGVHSATGAMGAIFEKRRDAIERFVERLRPVEHQVGAVFSLHGRERGIELFDAPATWSKLMPKIVRGWAVDALDDLDRKRNPKDSGIGGGLLDGLGAGKWMMSPSVGLGSDARLSDARNTGAALIVAGEVVHLAGFAARSRPGFDHPYA